MTHHNADEHEMRALRVLHQDELVLVARSLLSGSADWIECVRRIRGLAVQMDRLNDDLFIVFVGVDSELDGVPTGHRRSLWDADALKEVDAQSARYWEVVSPRLREGCEAILREFDRP